MSEATVTVYVPGDASACSLGADRVAHALEFEHRSADLRIEADGLESRIVNLRAVLLQLEDRRATMRPLEN
jgi:hypothetical protein